MASGRETRDKDRRSSIWISVAFRSWAATTLSSFSGWEDRDGGERRRLRKGGEWLIDFVLVGAKSKVVSISTAGAIAFAVVGRLERRLTMYSGWVLVGGEVAATCLRVFKEVCQLFRKDTDSPYKSPITLQTR